MKLAGHVAIVSGGTRGMGAATASRFLAEGAAVVIGDILPEVRRSTSDPRRLTTSVSSTTT